MKRNRYAGLGFLALAGTLGVGSVLLQRHSVVEAAAITAPRFEVDPLWPKPLPNHWLMGQTIGVSVDPQDHVWIIHRAGSLEAAETHAATRLPIAQCCAPAPPVLEFDQAGNLIGHWDGRARATTGRIRITASPSTTKATYGLAVTAADRRR